MCNTIIRCEKLNKRYGQHNVLHSVDLEVSAGKLVGFLGPNGAGKTTTIRILLGLLNPTSGQATIFNQPCRTQGHQIRRMVGYLPGDVHLYPNMTGRRLLKFLSRARRLNCNSEIERLAQVFELDIKRKIRKYSTGMRQKLGLIQALMHRPKLLILDEPTSALDPLIRKAVFEELQQVVQDGRTVLFSSHSLGEVEELCDEVIILRSGHIVEQQQIDSLKNNAIRRVKVVFEPREKPTDFPRDFELIEVEQNQVVGAWKGSSAELVAWLSTQGIVDVMIEKPDLNDLFLTYYRESESAKGSSNV